MPGASTNSMLRQFIKSAMKDRAPKAYAQLKASGLLEADADSRLAIIFEALASGIRRALIDLPAEPKAARVATACKAAIESLDRAMAMALDFGADASAAPSKKDRHFDLEMLAMGAELAAFHIEAGARSFAALAKVIAADLDVSIDTITPYLRVWYNGARDLMEDFGLSIEGMDEPGIVKAELARIVGAAAAAKAGVRGASALGGSEARVGLEAGSNGAGSHAVSATTAEHIVVAAGDLVTALESCRPRKSRKYKAVPITLSFSKSKGLLSIMEARHGDFEHSIRANGALVSEPQADGVWLFKVASSSDPTELLEIFVEEAALVVVRGTLRSRNSRIDEPEGNRIKLTQRRRLRHVPIPEGLAERRLHATTAQKKTWAFSAHMAPRGKK